MASNNFAVSPKDSSEVIFETIQNNISCRYFQIVAFVVSVISLFHNSVKLIPGNNSTITSLSLKISTFSYNISKNLFG